MPTIIIAYLLLNLISFTVNYISVKNDLQWWTVRSDTGKWGLVPAKCLKVINGTATNGEVTVHSPIESPDIVVRSVLSPSESLYAKISFVIFQLFYVYQTLYTFYYIICYYKTLMQN